MNEIIHYVSRRTFLKTDSEIELKLAGRFMNKGFTDAQAKLKAVWEHPNIASICTEMPNMTQLMANVAAAKNRRKLSAREVNLLRQYARETGSDYCKGVWITADLQDAGPRLQSSRHRAEDIMEAMLGRFLAEKLGLRETVTSPPVKPSQPNQLNQLNSPGRNKLCLLKTNAGPAGTL